ncbi:hypothetical protein E4U16_004244 [Claviceps sp. LM84 group G4]|nr:hypothetical protein E4U16_004244 [Claviceps sp. LM84 group G4]
MTVMAGSWIYSATKKVRAKTEINGTGALAVTAFAGIALAAKRSCRHDRRHPGMGWYWTGAGGDLEPVAQDFGDDAQAIATRNNLENKHVLPPQMVIYVKCPV